MKWLTKASPDILCLQEIKAQKDQLPDDLINLKNYHFYLNQAQKKGYSGVAVYTKEKPKKVEYTLGLKRFDNEGRILKLYFPKFTLINLYLPHGGREKENLDYKLKVYQRLFDYIKRIKDKNIILIGDFNIAHQEIDLARPKDNQNNIMFTPAEREQLDQLINLGFTDTFRKFNQKGGHYTWWPYFNNARQRNLGWRIDYAFASTRLITKLKSAFILNRTPGSDHCPVGVNVAS